MHGTFSLLRYFIPNDPDPFERVKLFYKNFLYLTLGYTCNFEKEFFLKYTIHGYIYLCRGVQTWYRCLFTFLLCHTIFLTAKIKIKIHISVINSLKFFFQFLQVHHADSTNFGGLVGASKRDVFAKVLVEAEGLFDGQRNWVCICDC